MHTETNILSVKNLMYILIGYIFSTKLTFAGNDTGILGKGITEEEIKNGDIHIEHIPDMIRGAIDFFIEIAGTIAIIFIIIGAYKILFGSLEQDKTKGKDTIIMALGGFAIASLAWFIIKVIIDNLS